MRMQHLKVHAQQITSRQRTHSGASPSLAGGTPESLAATAASPGLAQRASLFLASSPLAALHQCPSRASAPSLTDVLSPPAATPPSSAFSPGALNYNPNQLQQAVEARKMYRAQLLLSQQTQLEQAKRNSTALPRSTSASAVAAAAAVASVPTPSATPQAHEGEGSMPPPTRTMSLNSTPVVKELALGPSPDAGGAACGAEVRSSSATAKRRRESLGASVSEARETKKVRLASASSGPSPRSPDALPPRQRATQGDGDDDHRGEARSGTLGPENVTEASDDLVLVHDFAILPSSPKSSAPLVAVDDFVVVAEAGNAPEAASAGGFDAKELLFDPSAQPLDDLAGQFSLEQVRPLPLLTPRSRPSVTALTRSSCSSTPSSPRPSTRPALPSPSTASRSSTPPRSTTTTSWSHSPMKARRRTTRRRASTSPSEPTWPSCARALSSFLIFPSFALPLFSPSSFALSNPSRLPTCRLSFSSAPFHCRILLRQYPDLP